MNNQDSIKIKKHSSISHTLFRSWLGASCVFYISFLLLLLLANCVYVTKTEVSYDIIKDLFTSEEIFYSIKLTIFSSIVSTFISLCLAVPISYLFSRKSFFGKTFCNACLDIPLILPPLVVGLSLLIFFNTFPIGGEGESIDHFLGSYGLQITHSVGAVIIAQFTITTAYAVRVLNSVFEMQNQRYDSFASTLGASPLQVFYRVNLPLAKNGILTAALLSWAKSIGEFGPILVFAGATRGRTEVLSTTIFLELNTGNLQAAVLVSIAMILVSVSVIFCVKKVFTYGG